MFFDECLSVIISISSVSLSRDSHIVSSTMNILVVTHSLVVAASNVISVYVTVSPPHYGSSGALSD